MDDCFATEGCKIIQVWLLRNQPPRCRSCTRGYISTAEQIILHHGRQACLDGTDLRQLSRNI